MRSLPEADPRIGEHHSGYINRFLREVRKALPGIEISARIRNMNEFGLDAAAWVREGLVDTIIEGNWYTPNRPRDVEKGVLAVTRGTPVRAYVVAETETPGWTTPVEQRRWFSAADILDYARVYREKGIGRFGLYESTIFLWYPDMRRAIWEAAVIMAGGTR